MKNKFYNLRPSWSESSLDTVILLVLSWAGSNCFSVPEYFTVKPV